jgi:putative tricarboxylic transport membrane protein
MVEQGPLVYAILNAMPIANVLLLVIAYFTIPFFARVVTIRKSLLLPLTVVLAFAGAYVYRSDPTDLLFLVGFGMFGYFCRKFQFSVTPLVMAFILGPELERTVGQTLSIAQGDLLGFIVTKRPIALGLIIATPLLAWWMWRRAAAMQRTAQSLVASQRKEEAAPAQ